MTDLIRKIVVAASLSVMGFSTAFAADLTLREDITVVGDMIHLSDIFRGTEALEGTEDPVIMQAPLPGRKGFISPSLLSRHVSSVGGSWAKPEYLKRVRVKRDGILVTRDMIENMVQTEALAQGLDESYAITLFGGIDGHYLPVDYDPADFRLEHMTINRGSNRLTAKMLIPLGRGDDKTLTVNGRFEAMRMVPMLSRTVATGEIITPDHIRWQKIPARRVGRDTVVSEESLLGKTVRRTLQPDMALRGADVMAPITVKKGSYVTMIFKVGSLTLTAGGRAQQNGGTGDIIRLTNTSSGISVDGRVVSPDRVEVINQTQLLASN